MLEYLDLPAMAKNFNEAYEDPSYINRDKWDVFEELVATEFTAKHNSDLKD